MIAKLFESNTTELKNFLNENKQNQTRRGSLILDRKCAGLISEIGRVGDRVYFNLKH